MLKLFELGLAITQGNLKYTVNEFPYSRHMVGTVDTCLHGVLASVTVSWSPPVEQISNESSFACFNSRCSAWACVVFLERFPVRAVIRNVSCILRFSMCTNWKCL